MDVCLQLHGEKIIYPIPSGLHELMWDISKEVLRKQPSDIYYFIYKYLNSMLKLREATKNAVVVVDDIVNESSEIVKHINNLGTTLNIANSAATKIQNCFKSFILRNLLKKERENGDEMSKSILEYLKTNQLDYEEVVKACRIIQRSYRRHKASKVSLAISDGDIKTICDPNKLVYEESPKRSGSKALDKEEARLEETQYEMNSLKHYSTEKLEEKLFDFTEMKPSLLQNINSEKNLIYPTIPEEFIEIDFTQILESPNSNDLFSQNKNLSLNLEVGSKGGDDITPAIDSLIFSASETPATSISKLSEIKQRKESMTSASSGANSISSSNKSLNRQVSKEEDLSKSQSLKKTSMSLEGDTTSISNDGVEITISKLQGSKEDLSKPQSLMKTSMSLEGDTTSISNDGETKQI